MKRIQCQAIAKSTQKQCTKKAMWGTSYCWLHYPRRESFIILFIGAVLGLFLQVVWDFFTISTEEREIIKLRQDIKKYQDENKRLKVIINQQRAKLFDVFPAPDSGIILYSRQDSIVKRYNQALDLYKKGRLLEAKELLEIILQKDPEDVDTLNLLGIVLNELGNTDEALKCLNKAYRLSKAPCILNNIALIRKFPGKEIEYKEIEKPK